MIAFSLNKQIVFLNRLSRVKLIKYYFMSLSEVIPLLFVPS